MYVKKDVSKGDVDVSSEKYYNKNNIFLWG